MEACRRIVVSLMIGHMARIVRFDRFDRSTVIAVIATSLLRSLLATVVLRLATSRIVAISVLRYLNSE